MIYPALGAVRRSGLGGRREDRRLPVLVTPYGPLNLLALRLQAMVDQCR